MTWIKDTRSKDYVSKDNLFFGSLSLLHLRKVCVHLQYLLHSQFFWERNFAGVRATLLVAIFYSLKTALNGAQTLKALRNRTVVLLISGHPVQPDQNRKEFFSN